MLMTIFLADHETTATEMTMALNLIAKHAHSHRRLEEAVGAVPVPYTQMTVQ